ncbi:MAG TPA: c-type cytochrome [Streptosporangiaceae bacterium]|nr:c-type cytochrome [Streptosporangiaceae bacterium]
MSWITARRRHPAAGYAVVLLGLVSVGTVYAAATQSASAATATPAPGSPQALAIGRNLFITTCSSCHGNFGQGTDAGPSLIGVGAAAVDFQVSTGRMPAKEATAEMDRKPPVFNEQQTHDIAAYVESLGGGPPIPPAADVSTNGANVALGQNLFITNCSQCHNFSGAGGALTYGKYAPALDQSTPTQIAEAMQTGPEAMPNFSMLTTAQQRDIIAYITKVRSEPNPGGFSLGRVGPVTEGIVGFLGGVGALVFAAMWITAGRRGSKA